MLYTVNQCVNRRLLSNAYTIGKMLYTVNQQCFHINHGHYSAFPGSKIIFI